MHTVNCGFPSDWAIYFEIHILRFIGRHNVCTRKFLQNFEFVFTFFVIDFFCFSHSVRISVNISTLQKDSFWKFFLNFSRNARRDISTFFNHFWHRLSFLRSNVCRSGPIKFRKKFLKMAKFAKKNWCLIKSDLTY